MVVRPITGVSLFVVLVFTDREISEGVRIQGSGKVHPVVYTRLDECVRAGSGEVCVIVGLRDTSRAGEPRARRREKFSLMAKRVLSRLDVDEYRLRYRYRSSPRVVLSTRARSVLRALEADADVKSVSLDRRGAGAVEESRAVARVDEVFELGFAGEGRVVAVLDTGVDTDHPDLAGSIISEKSLLDQGSTVEDTAEDGHGHGTNVTGIIASTGTVSPRSLSKKCFEVEIEASRAQLKERTGADTGSIGEDSRR